MTAAKLPAADAVLYRVFLKDGGVLVSYGEFANVADKVVLSMPIGGTDSAPVLHLISIPEKDVEWERTNAYAQAARARHYAATQAENDFARLTREVSGTLYKIGSTADPATRLEMAESARKQLVEWPQYHYGYRADELGQMTTWLDRSSPSCGSPRENPASISRSSPPRRRLRSPTSTCCRRRRSASVSSSASQRRG